MNRALLWKEWREQRPLVITGLLVAALMPLFLIAGLSALSPRGADLNSLSEALPGLYVLLLWPLFAAAAGAGTVATELGDGTLGFLLSRPVSRLRVWLIKVALAALGFGLVLACSLLVSWVLYMLAPGAAWPDLFGEHAVALLGLPVASQVVLIFCAAVFFSTVMSRAMTAAAAGLVSALILLSFIYLLWSKIDLMPLLEPQWMALEIFLVAMLVLLASLYLFSRGEMLRGRGARRTALLAAVMALGVAALVTLPVLFLSARVTPESARFLTWSLSAKGDTVLATVATPAGGSLQVWMVPTDGSPFQRATGRLTLAGDLSPDGEWLVYLSLRGPLGLRRSGPPELRIRRTDGRDDRRLGTLELDVTEVFFEPPPLLFSPDGSRILVGDESGVLKVFPVDGSPPLVRDLAGTPLEGAVPFGWDPQGHEALARRYPGEQGGPWVVGAVNVDSGRMRTIFQTMQRVYNPLGWYQRLRSAPLLGSSLVLTTLQEGAESVREFELLLVDLGDGSRRTVTHGYCLPRFAIDARNQALFYLTCPEPGADAVPFHEREGRAELHRWSPDGTDVIVAQGLATSPWSIRLSPGGDRLLIVDAGPDRVVELDGTMRELEPTGGSVLGWSGRDRLVAVDGEYGNAKVQVVNATDGTARQVFP